jgi:hypothetical protein
LTPFVPGNCFGSITLVTVSHEVIRRTAGYGKLEFSRVLDAARINGVALLGETR